MGNLLEVFQNEESIVTRDTYESAISEIELPAGSNVADWDFFLSRKHGLAQLHADGPPEGHWRCRAYRLLNKEYAPLSVAKWSAKGISETRMP